MLNLLPTPKQCELFEDMVYTIKNCVISKDPEWNDCAEFIKSSHFLASGFPLSDGEGGIELIRDSSIKAGEYRLINDGVLRAYASDFEGMCYATASIIQLTSSRSEEIKLPKFSIYDYADKDYRSFMLDLAREWHPFQQLLRYVDICALYKIKYLQLHFIDTEIYSLPSKVFPKLPTKGKHYTFEQIEELCAYAKKRNIILVPEYECPGHGRLFTTIYPEVFANNYDDGLDEMCMTDGAFEVPIADLMCAGREESLEGTYALLKEIAEMFPESKYIHIGGDEAAISLWDKCPDCREYMKKNNMDGVYELYGEYVGRVTKYVLSIGRTPIVWEGFSKDYSHYVPKETIVVAWETLYNYADDLIADGFKIINAASMPLYIVPRFFNEIERARERCFSYTRDILDWNIYTWRNWSPASAATLNPLTIPATDDLLGCMMCSWSQTYEQEIYFVLENLITMSERVWNVKRVCNDDEFLSIQGTIMAIVSRITQER